MNPSVDGADHSITRAQNRGRGFTGSRPSVTRTQDPPRHRILAQHRVRDIRIVTQWILFRQTKPRFVRADSAARHHAREPFGLLLRHIFEKRVDPRRVKPLQRNPDTRFRMYLGQPLRQLLDNGITSSGGLSPGSRRGRKSRRAEDTPCRMPHASRSPSAVVPCPRIEHRRRPHPIVTSTGRRSRSSVHSSRHA